jgi:hypothetical protein
VEAVARSRFIPCETKAGHARQGAPQMTRGNARWSLGATLWISLGLLIVASSNRTGSAFFAAPRDDTHGPTASHAAIPTRKR